MVPDVGGSNPLTRPNYMKKKNRKNSKKKSNKNRGVFLDRRSVLKKGVFITTIASVGGPGFLSYAKDDSLDSVIPKWRKEEGLPFTNYGKPSHHEDHVIRWIVANRDVLGHGASWTPLHLLEGTITPNGLHFERHHDGVPAIDPNKHKFILHGLVKKNLIFTIKDLLRYPMTSKICFIECGGNSESGWGSKPRQSYAGYLHGLVSCAEWTGVPLKILFKEAGLSGEAKWIEAEGADGGSLNVSVPTSKALKDGFIALYQNGERLRPENGYPMRLIFPGWEGITHVKWLTRIKAVKKPVMSRNETSKYTDLMSTGFARQFSFVMQPKSVITRPSPGLKMERKGFYELSGLAWSGNGRIKKVEVSLDGGSRWITAKLQKPVLDKSFTRFRLPWLWDGKTQILQSRCFDDKGLSQPTRDELISRFGVFSSFHFNGIISWKISSNGKITQVYI